MAWGQHLDLKNSFEEHTKKAYLESAFKVELELAGLKSGNLSSLMDRSATATQENYNKTQSAQQIREQNAFDDAMFLAALQTERDWHADKMDEYEDPLIAKYGEDFIGGMAATYLPEDVAQGLQTDDERMAALREIMLDDEGNIKPEYADTPEANYVYHWNKTQVLDAALENVKEGVPLTVEQKDAVVEADAAALANDYVASHEEAARLAQENVEAIDAKVEATAEATF